MIKSYYNSYGDRTWPEVGDVIQCDGWSAWDSSLLQKDDGFKDIGFPGCMFRLPMDRYSMAVNVTITGRVPTQHNGTTGWYRCKVEFVGDGEPSDFTGGWIQLR